MQIKNLSMSFGTQDLFTNINLQISDEEKVGIVGVNGAGKSTFLKIIMGQVEPDFGEIILKKDARIGYLPQVLNDEVPSLDITVFDFLLAGRPIDKLNKKLQIIYDKMASVKENELNKLYKEMEKINQKLDYWESYNAESILLKIINGMNISDELLKQKLCELSGGQKSKVAFAKLLYSKPEFILLDEPTNHLDEETKEYVINFLKNYKGGVFVISHDTDFLNKIVTKILFLDKRLKTLKLFDGNYDNFKQINTEYEKTLQREIMKQNKEEEKLRALINKYSNVSGKRKKMAQDREKKLEKLLESKIDLGEKIKQAKIEMSMRRESTNIPLTVKNLCFRYNKEAKNYIIDNLSFSLTKGEKFLIVGKNGVGKSTLLKLIIGQLSADSGEIILGAKTDLGYYAQEHELLDNEKTILENFRDSNISMKVLRNVLGRFLFYGDDVYKKVGILSPGERSRVALAKLSLEGANLLVLDEPTNHLDPETQAIIADTFKTFQGTMLVVSHNPEFVDNLGIERTLILPDGKIDYYNRNLVQHYHDLNTNVNVKKK